MSEVFKGCAWNGMARLDAPRPPGMVSPGGGWEGLAVTSRYDAKQLARLCGVSPRQLQRNFKRQLARSPQDWLNEQRIIAAQQLLLSGQPVKVVAFQLGFKQSSHFCRQFKRQSNMTPSEYAHV